MTNKNHYKYFFESLSFIIMVLFIGGNSTLYFFLKNKYSLAGTLINGIILSASTGTFNAIYTRVLNVLVSLENHRFIN